MLHQQSWWLYVYNWFMYYWWYYNSKNHLFCSYTFAKRWAGEDFKSRWFANDPEWTKWKRKTRWISNSIESRLSKGSPCVVRWQQEISGMFLVPSFWILNLYFFTNNCFNLELYNCVVNIWHRVVLWPAVLVTLLLILLESQLFQRFSSTTSFQMIKFSL